MDRSIWIGRLVVVGAAAITLLGIGSFGIWDPWELVPRWSTGLAFDLFGASELSARLPGAVGGLAVGALTYALVCGSSDERAAVISVAILAATPLFLLNARLSMGDAAGMAGQAWVGVASVAASSTDARRPKAWVRYALLCAAIAVSAAVSGVLLGPFPPVAAVAAWSLMPDGQRAPTVPRWLFPVAALVMALGILRAVTLDAPDYSHWLGGGAVGGDPPTWDEVFELVFHGFAPWSAVLPVAAVGMLQPRTTRPADAQRLAWLLLLWIAFAFVSWTIFASRYGSPPFLAVSALAALVALWLREMDGERPARWPAAAVIALLTGLLVRDYLLYPESPLRALAAEAPTIPEVYRGGRWWTVLFTTANATVCLMLIGGGSIGRPDPRRTLRWLEAQSRAGWPRRGWLLLGLSLLGACLAFGAMCFVLELPIASVVVRAGKVAFFVPIALAAAVFGLPWISHAYERLQRLRLVPVLVASLLVGAFVSFSFLPALSQHFSPKPVFAAYEALRSEEGEPLASYRTSTAAARYYTDATIRELDGETALLGFLEEGGQRWAVIPSDRLPSLDRAKRRRDGTHLYVADARSARLLLLAARPVPGRANQSFVPATVLSEPPAPEHPVKARFDDRVELLGYDLGLAGGDTVGAGQRFSLTWYWRVLQKPPAGYEVFVHIDGNALRLNGDHEPTGGRYPTRLWEPGNIIVDAQELTVPANFRAGDYPIYVGWYSGSKRLAVESGPNDGENRVRAGVLPVR